MNGWITEWGKHCLEKGEYLPLDAGLFMERIRKEIPTLDSVVELYLGESLHLQSDVSPWPL